MASNNYTVAQDGKVFTLSGPEMTRDFNQMKRECCGRYDNFIFPDAKKVVDLLKEQGRSPMTHEQIMEVHGKGTHTDYYDTIYCYYCVNKNNYSGINVEKRNPKSIASGIKKICSSKKIYDGFSERAYLRYLEKFTKNKMNNSLQNIYKKVLLK